MLIKLWYVQQKSSQMIYIEHPSSPLLSHHGYLPLTITVQVAWLIYYCRAMIKAGGEGPGMSSFVCNPLQRHLSYGKQCGLPHPLSACSDSLLHKVSCTPETLHVEQFMMWRYCSTISASTNWVRSLLVPFWEGQRLPCPSTQTWIGTVIVATGRQAA